MTTWVIYQQLEVPRFGLIWMRRGRPMAGNNAEEALRAFARTSVAATQGRFMVVPEHNAKPLKLEATTEYRVVED